MVRQVRQLAGARAHAALEQALVAGDLLVGFGELQRHLVEGLSQLVQFACAAGRHAYVVVAARQEVGRPGQPADRARDAQHGRE